MTTVPAKRPRSGDGLSRLRAEGREVLLHLQSPRPSRLNGYVTPYTLEERLMQIQEAKRTLGSRIPWISDTMSNDLKHALGDASNPEFIIDPDGRLANKRMWSDPEGLREDLARLVGPVENPTRIADLDLEIPPPRERAAKGVVPSIETPWGMQALEVDPVSTDDNVPFYVKLRAEAGRDLLRRGAGKLYLGFHLDPIYAVHWNNLVDPLHFELQLPQGTASPLSGTGPKVDVEADSDPREFLIEVDAWQSETPLQATIRYFACDDAETFCIPVTQEFRISLERDSDGGRRTGTFPGRGGGGMAGRLRDRDTNRDGRISRDEVPEQMGRIFARLDTNGDGFIDEDELDRMASGTRMQRFLERDEDGDGRLSRDELPERMRQRFDRMDANDDGYVDREELEVMFERIRRRENNR